MRGPGPPAALEGAWYQAASIRGGRGKLRARDGHRGESAASFTWLHDRHGVNIFVSASYVETGCLRAGPPPKAGPAQAAVDSATEAPESGWCLAYSSSLGRRVIGEIIPESCIHLCEKPTARIASAVLGRQGQTWGGQVSDREQGRGAGVRPPARRQSWPRRARAGASRAGQDAPALLGAGGGVTGGARCWSARAPGSGRPLCAPRPAVTPRCRRWFRRLCSPSHNPLYGTLPPHRPHPLRILNQ